MRGARHGSGLLAAGAMFALAVNAAQAATSVPDYDRAAAALSDIRLAISTITAAEDNASNGPARYKQAAQRAINCLVGQGDEAYDLSLIHI